MELVAQSLVKRYPGVLALDGVSITVRGSEVHAVAGENGAGKSTLMQLLSGAITPDGGTITVDGREVRFASPHDAHALGIRMIHQELSLVPELSVAENIFLGAEPARRGMVDRARQRREARAVLDRLGQTSLDTDARIDDLSLAARQMTEIAKSVSQRARVLIMDEPTAILAHEETEALFAVIAQLSAEGVAIVYISHRLEEIFRIASRVTVLRDGRLVTSASLGELSRGEIVRLMVGRELSAGYPRATQPPGEEILRVERLSSGPVRDATLALRRGEIVGLVGLVGAGRTELARAIFGAEPTTAGAMFVDGAPYRPRSPHDAIAAGLALLPEDRKRQGLVLEATIRENTSLPSLRALVRAGMARAAAAVRGRPASAMPVLSRAGVVNRARERGEVTRWVEALKVRTPSVERPARQLSGGNQQKVVVARWLLAHSHILLVDEPTRGIDVGAKAEIYALMRRLADEGAAILMISSDLPEALGMADRLLVMRGGRIVGELSRAEATPERVASLILGESSAA
ncbi:MAG TPA: sugar ABC transporter ATP-binding protein [Gemmatimonadaceae bacterium]|nr:sugar ABC transporter ATP-binding protein [Gemmatimonadaceae bacterium]